MPAALYGLVRKRGRNAAVNEMMNINVLFIMKFVNFAAPWEIDCVYRY